jgi:hypothetical protein
MAWGASDSGGPQGWCQGAPGTGVTALVPGAFAGYPCDRGFGAAESLGNELGRSLG